MFFYNFFFTENSLSNEIQFEANTIDTTNENIIIASGDLKIVNSMGQEIFADKLELDNKNKIHKVLGIFIMRISLKIKFIVIF